MLRSTFFSALAAGVAASAVIPGVANCTPNMSSNRTARRNVGVLLGDYSVLLDWAGPAEVFFSSGFNENSSVDEFKILTIAKSSAQVRLQVLGYLRPDYSIQNAPKLAVVILPGSMPTDLPKDAATVAWLKKQVAGGTILLTVCTGAIVAARMGVLEGLTITTQHDAIGILRKLVPTATVVTDRRFVDNGTVVTTAGSAAGIAGALHVVQRLIGQQRATDEQQYLEYDWEATSSAPHIQNARILSKQ